MSTTAVLNPPAPTRRELPGFTPDGRGGFTFSHRGLTLSTYRPVGFAGGREVTYGWSVFWEINGESREEITGGWAHRSRAVRAALDVIDKRAERAADSPRVLREPERCCTHADADHVIGRYTRTRCGVRKCGCAMYGRGPLVALRPEDVTRGVVLALYSTHRGAFELPARVVAEHGADVVRIASAGTSPGGRVVADFARGSIVYALAHTVPASTPIVPE